MDMSFLNEHFVVFPSSTRTNLAKYPQSFLTREAAEAFISTQPHPEDLRLLEGTWTIGYDYAIFKPKEATAEAANAE